MARLRICFEIDGLAEDENGTPCPAGLQLDLGETDQIVDYGELAESVNMRGLLDYACLYNIPETAVRIITPEEYDRKYGED